MGRILRVVSHEVTVTVDLMVGENVKKRENDDTVPVRPKTQGKILVLTFLANVTTISGSVAATVRTNSSLTVTFVAVTVTQHYALDAPGQVIYSLSVLLAENFAFFA